MQLSVQQMWFWYDTVNLKQTGKLSLCLLAIFSTFLCSSLFEV